MHHGTSRALRLVVEGLAVASLLQRDLVAEAVGQDLLISNELPSSSSRMVDAHLQDSVVQRLDVIHQSSFLLAWFLGVQRSVICYIRGSGHEILGYRFGRLLKA